MEGVGFAWADRFPRFVISLEGGLENNGFEGFFSSPLTYMIGELTSPIFSFGKRKAKYEAAIKAYDAERFQYEKKVLQAFKEVNDAVISYTSANKTVELMQNLKESSRKYVDLALFQHINGHINYIDVLDAQRSYLNAEIDLSKLPVGDWDLDVKYAGADGYKDVYYVGVYVEKAPVKIRAISTNVAYNDEYKVIVIGQNGKGLKNAKVTFKINGKKVKTIKTNSIGIAKFKIPAKYGPKKYTITAIYKKTKLSKKVSVKHSVTLKTSKVKKSSKLILKAKVNKALKSKRVTFKFNGKTYHAKANSKGIAKVTLKKSALANLKVGSRVKIQATCLKDTVKKSLKVQK
jgi:hypothetical protein